MAEGKGKVLRWGTGILPEESRTLGSGGQLVGQQEGNAERSAVLESRLEENQRRRDGRDCKMPNPNWAEREERGGIEEKKEKFLKKITGFAQGRERWPEEVLLFSRGKGGFTNLAEGNRRLERKLWAKRGGEIKDSKRKKREFSVNIQNSTCPWKEIKTELSEGGKRKN